MVCVGIEVKEGVALSDVNGVYVGDDSMLLLVMKEGE